jgi:hypothetical protein
MKIIIFYLFFVKYLAEEIFLHNFPLHFFRNLCLPKLALSFPKAKRQKGGLKLGFIVTRITPCNIGITAKRLRIE